MDAKRITTGMITGLLAATLLAGCGGGGGKSSGGSGGSGGNAANNPPKIETPARAPVSTAPAMTFKFGSTEAKVYELTGVDLKKDIRTNRIVTLGDDIFFHTDSAGNEDNLGHMKKVTMKNETISNLTDLGPSGDIHELATNGKEVVWPGSSKTDAKEKTVIYNGKETAVRGKWLGKTMGDPETGNYFVGRGPKFMEAKLENGEWKEVKVLVEDTRKLDQGFDRVIFNPVSVVKGELYMRYVLPKKEGEKDDTPMLAAFGKDGKMLRTYEGVKELPRGWAVTDNYVIATGSQGIFRVYERQSGKLLGEAKIQMRPFALWTKTGNDVIVYDDRAKKLYRIDF